MSKFVTYGATETLDNDQKFIIDSDRTGPGSITAKDAASSLLSKWAGFETFEEAVQNTISNNQEFIDRDTAIRSETAELKKKIVTTFPAKDASGAVATFESEFEDAPLKSCIVRVEPVQDLHGYDSPWPAGGGKNLADTRNLDVTVAGIHCVSDSDGVISLSGTRDSSTGWKVLTVFTDFAPGNYVFSSNNQHVTCLLNYTQKSGTFTVAEGDVVRIALYNTVIGDVLNDTGIKVQIESGNTATEWTPYENICPITGWTGCEVQRTGVNLLNLSEWKTGSEGGITIGTDNISIINKGYQEKNNRYNILNQSACMFSFHVKTVSLSDSRASFAVYANETTKLLGDDTTNTGNITLDSVGTEKNITLTVPNGIEYISFGGWAWGGEVQISNIQLELGSTPTPYEPYTGRTYPITFPTEAGTVYGAYVDVTGGELVVDRAMVDLGTLTWSTNSNNRAYINNFTTAYGCALPQSAYNVAGCIAEQYKEIPASGSLTPGTFAILQVEAIYFYYDGTNLPTGKMVFPLAEPIHYPLTPIEIKTLLGTNNIWSNTGDTEVEYLMSDVSWYVEKKLRAFQSVLAGVEDSAVASKNYSTNSYLIFDDDIYRVTKTITAGETIEEGVNVTKTTVAEQLMALAQA